MNRRLRNSLMEFVWRPAPTSRGTGLSATSPRSFLAVGFPLLSLAERTAQSHTFNLVN
ncbi:MAG: hypothetical protein ACKVOQ_18265 [Cyclobacteriaceae bacterium]